MSHVEPWGPASLSLEKTGLSAEGKDHHSSCCLRLEQVQLISEGGVRALWSHAATGVEAK